MSIKIYDPDQVSVIFGALILGGFADGSFLTISQPEKDFETVVGTDGLVTRSKTGNTVTEVTVKLMQTSDSNAALSAIRNLDLRTPNGAGVAPFLVRDRQGVSVLTAAEAWIEGPPEADFDRTAGSREWKFILANPERVI